MEETGRIRIPTPPPASSESRARIMASIRRRDTMPELALRSALHAMGLRFRKDLRLDLGAVKPRPDIVFTRARVAVFVDGCFWHCCPDHGNAPTTNSAYWTPKLARNVQRDREYDHALVEAGWTVVRVWEHELLEDAVALVSTGLIEAGYGPSSRRA